MLATLQLEGAYHLQDLLFDRGVRTSRQLSNMSVEHVRAMPCTNSEKTALLHASRSARLSVAADHGAATIGWSATGEGFGDANVALLTSRGAGGFLPLFSHRIEKLEQHAAAEGDIAQDLRTAVGSRDLDAMRRILRTEEGKRILNKHYGDGWTVLQRACASRRDAGAIASGPPATPAPSLSPAGQEPLHRLPVSYHLLVGVSGDPITYL